MSLNTRIKRYWQKIIGLNDFYFPPGHFYNPLSSRKEIEGLGRGFFEIDNSNIPEIPIDSLKMKNLLNEYATYYKQFIDLFCDGKQRKFNVQNGYYSYSDAIFLFCIFKENKPKRYYEVGSGFSSILSIETNELCFDNFIDIKLIEPYPSERLLKLLKGDEKNVEIISKKIQDIPLSFFCALEKNDILFIDSSHVSKIGSDLNYIIFNILPILNTGVLIHFHDIFYPFEYPKSWAFSNRWHSWNEAYLLRAFLMYNDSFEIKFWNSYCEINFDSVMKKEFPLYYKGGSSSIWLQKK